MRENSHKNGKRWEKILAQREKGEKNFSQKKGKRWEKILTKRWGKTLTVRWEKISSHKVWVRGEKTFSKKKREISDLQSISSDGRCSKKWLNSPPSWHYSLLFQPRVDKEEKNPGEGRLTLFFSFFEFLSTLWDTKHQKCISPNLAQSCPLEKTEDWIGKQAQWREEALNSRDAGWRPRMVETWEFRFPKKKETDFE